MQLVDKQQKQQQQQQEQQHWWPWQLTAGQQWSRCSTGLS
jgi:hypothetical protein